MKNSDLKLYLGFALFFMALMFIFETLQLKVALKREMAFQYYVIPVLMGAAFGLLIAHVKILSKRVEYSAITDPLTDLYNRKWLNEKFSEHIERYRRYQTDLSIILLDIDKFKRVNDTYGHQVGDEILVRVSELLKESSRTTDFCCRWGGEEFLLLLPNTDLEGAKIKAETIRKVIADEVFSIGQVTCSFGVTALDSVEHEEKELVHQADEALYEAKNGGRNRICVFA